MLKKVRKNLILSIVVVLFFITIFFFGDKFLAVGLIMGYAMATLSNIKLDIDPLTGLFGEDSLEKDYKKLNKKSIYLVYIDINDFKLINDNYGHDVGDEVLVFFANNLKKLSKTYDFISVYRLHGDEFAILFKREIPLYTLRFILNGIQKDFNQKIKVEFAYGVNHILCASKQNFKEVLKKADEKMYKHKASLYMKKV